MKSSVIARGKLRNLEQSFDVRLLGMGHVQEMLELQQDVKQTVQKASSLQPLSKQEFEYIFSGKGFIIGIYVNKRMIAFRAMLEPPVDDPEHLGLDAGLTKQDLLKIIYSEITVVHPSFRGNGLQTYMGNIVLDQVDKKRYPYVAATVAPFNIPSLKDKLALGMNIVGLKEKYDGMLRYIFFKEFERDSKVPSANEQKLDMAATEMQQKLLNEGYRGVAINQVGETYQVVYQK